MPDEDEDSQMPPNSVSAAAPAHPPAAVPKYSNPEVNSFHLLHSRPKINTPSELEAAILLYVDTMWNARGIGCTMNDLNRRFSRAAKSLGRRVLEVVTDLANEDRLVLMEYKRNGIVASVAFRKAMTNLTLSDLDAAAEFQRSVLVMTMEG